MPKRKPKKAPIYARQAFAHGEAMQIHLPGAPWYIDVGGDWYGAKKKKFQLIVTAANNDDPALLIRFNDDGSIHSTVVSHANWSKLRREGRLSDDWEEERDGKPPKPKKSKS